MIIKEIEYVNFNVGYSTVGNYRCGVILGTRKGDVNSVIKSVMSTYNKAPSDYLIKFLISTDKSIPLGFCKIGYHVLDYNYMRNNPQFLLSKYINTINLARRLIKNKGKFNESK